MQFGFPNNITDFFVKRLFFSGVFKSLYHLYQNLQSLYSEQDWILPDAKDGIARPPVAK